MASPFDAGAAKNTDPLEFLKTLWTPMGIPFPGMVTPTLDVGEVDKRIADLKSVENWLNLNLNVLRMTIQGLEMQKATLAAMQGGMAAALDAANTAGTTEVPSGGASPAADAWWAVLQQAQKATELAVDQMSGAVMPSHVADTGKSGKK